MITVVFPPSTISIGITRALVVHCNLVNKPGEQTRVGFYERQQLDNSPPTMYRKRMVLSSA